MAGKILSPEEIKRLKAARKAGKRPEPPAAAAKAKPPSDPLPAPSQPLPELAPGVDDAEHFKTVDVGVLIGYARDECSESGIKNLAGLIVKRPVLAAALAGANAEGQDVTDRVFTSKPPPEPSRISIAPSRHPSSQSPGNSSRSARPSMPPPPIRSSAPSPPESSEGSQSAYVITPDSGAYDETGVQPPFQAREELAALENEIQGIVTHKSWQAQDKLDAARLLYTRRINDVDLKRAVGSDILRATETARARLDYEKEPADAYLLALDEFNRVMIPQFEGVAKEFAANAHEAANNAAPAQAEPSSGSAVSEPTFITPEKKETKAVLPHKKSSKKTSKPSFIKGILGTPMTYAVLTVGSVSSLIYGLNKFENIEIGFKKLTGLDLSSPWSHVAYWTTLAAGLGMTELLRRRDVAKEAQRLEERAQMAIDAEAAISDVLTKIARIRKKHKDLKTQSTRLRQLMVDDEGFFDAIDYLYSTEVVWDDVMRESRLHRAVKRAFPMLREEAEDEIIRKRLATLVQFHQQPTHRKNKLKELCREDPLFRRKFGEMFAKDEDGDHVNRDLLERLGNLKYDIPVDAKAFLAGLEEDYTLIRAEDSSVLK